MNKDWSYVTIGAWRRTEYMVIKPMIGGSWSKVCICKFEGDAKRIIEAVNKIEEADNA